MIENGAELTSYTRAGNLMELLKGEYIDKALVRIPATLNAVAILVYEVGK
jgi:hypothetical protein